MCISLTFFVWKNLTSLIFLSDNYYNYSYCRYQTLTTKNTILRAILLNSKLLKQTHLSLSNNNHCNKNVLSFQNKCSSYSVLNANYYG